jgi:membrane-associated protease RseP (regulator of RpoE activity)
MNGMDGLPAASIGPLYIWLALLAVTLWHELGHCLAARSVGIPVRVLSVGFGPVLWQRTLRDDSVLLLRALPVGMSIGVPSRYSAAGHPLRPTAHDVWIAAGGPVASLLLMLLLFGLAHWLPLPIGVAHGLVGVGLLSVVVALFNLLPLPGLDGGHLLLLMTGRFGNRLSPEQEMRIHRIGLKWLTMACLVPLGLALVSWLGGIHG